MFPIIQDIFDTSRWVTEARTRGLDVDRLYNSDDHTVVIREKALPWLVGRGLDVGCGFEKVVETAIGIDSGADYGAEEVVENGCVQTRKGVQDDLRDASDLSGYEGVDYVFSSHTLEHVADWEGVLGEWCRVLRPGGVLFVYLPRSDVFYPWKAGVLKNHLHDFVPEMIVGKLKELGMTVVEFEPEYDSHASFHVVARKP